MSTNGLEVFDKTLETTHIWLKEIMEGSYQEVSILAQEEGVPLRTAAQMIGVGRVAEAHRTRGLYP